MAKSKYVLGIDFNPISAKAVGILRGTKEVVFTDLCELNADPLKHSQALALWVKMCLEAIPGGTADLSVCYPSEISVLHHLCIPLEDKSAEAYAYWAMGQYLTSPVEDYVLDHHILGKSSDGKFYQAIAGGVRKNQIIPFLQGFASEYIKPSLLEMDAFALINALEFSEGPEFRRHPVIVKADKTSVKVIWLQEGLYRTLQCIPVGNYDEEGKWESLPSDFGQIIDELRMLLSAGIKQGSATFYICGDLVVDENFLETLNNAGLPEFEFLNPFNVCTTNRDEVKVVLNSPTAPQYSAALGAALRFKGDRK